MEKRRVAVRGRLVKRRKVDDTKPDRVLWRVDALVVCDSRRRDSGRIRPSPLARRVASDVVRTSPKGHRGNDRAGDLLCDHRLEYRHRGVEVSGTRAGSGGEPPGRGPAWN